MNYTTTTNILISNSSGLLIGLIPFLYVYPLVEDMSNPCVFVDNVLPLNLGFSDYLHRNHLEMVLRIFFGQCEINPK